MAFLYKYGNNTTESLTNSQLWVVSDLDLNHLEMSEGYKGNATSPIELGHQLIHTEMCLILNIQKHFQAFSIESLITVYILNLKYWTINIKKGVVQKFVVKI